MVMFQKLIIFFILAQPCYFTKQLMSKREIEHREVTLHCQVINKSIIYKTFEKPISI